MCNTLYGFSGFQCDQWCDQAVAILVVNIVESCCAFILFIASIYLLLGTIRCKPHCRVTPMMITLIFTGIGMLFYVIAPITSTIVSLGFPKLYIVSKDNRFREIKRIPQSMEYCNSTLFALAYCISVSAIVMLSLTWVRKRSEYNNDDTFFQSVCIGWETNVTILKKILRRLM